MNMIVHIRVLSFPMPMDRFHKLLVIYSFDGFLFFLELLA